jgi:methylenetetrahydrofolate dehydrogenase (NADP+)/methenyltetrahydrofolate cyclohydrolase
MSEMPALILDGKKVAEKVRAGVAERVKALAARGVKVGLGVVRVGEDPASAVYVRLKRAACEKAGILSKELHLAEGASQAEVLGAVATLNRDPEISGILVQLPLPRQLREAEVLDSIRADKDADGLHLMSVGGLWAGRDGTLPCTPAGVMEILRHYDISPRGKRAVVLGRSLIVGKPMAGLLIRADATVTVCHSKTRDLDEVCRQAEILIVAAGRKALVRGSWIRPGAVVVDVGVNREGDRLVGDVAFDEASAVAGAITPVPGGVGPMTIAMLLSNTVGLAEKNTP